ncbi:MAG: hypothetical protein K8S62_00825 [Candidatus Sabulitectum sp.]|nr:hypothetical protein [Candidatus Sabulitectum sp.]
MTLLRDCRKTKIVISVALFVIPFLVYIQGFRYLGSGDTVGNELLAISLIREGNFDYNEFCPSGDEEELGYVFKWSRGRIVNICPIVTGMMNVPVFLAADVVGIDIEEKILPLNIVSMSLLAALSTVLMFHILLRKRFSTGLSAFLAVVFASGTLVWSVTARGTWQHGPSIFFLCAGMFLFFSENRRAFAWAGFFFALMCVNRPVNGLIVLPFYVYTLFHRRKDFLLLVLTSLIPVAFLAWYSLEYWGSLLSLGQGQSGKFTTDPWLGIPGLLFSPARGLLVFTPVFIFSILYMVKDVFSKGGNILYRYLSVGFFVTLIIYTIWERWYGGHCFGYRYLSEYIPIMVLFLAEGWNRYVKPKVWTRVLFGILFFLSVYFNFLGAVVFPSDFNTVPNNIDYNDDRLWTIEDTELLRLNDMFVERLLKRF